MRVLLIRLPGRGSCGSLSKSLGCNPRPELQRLSALLGEGNHDVLSRGLVAARGKLIDELELTPLPFHADIRFVKPGDATHLLSRAIERIDGGFVETGCDNH